MGKHKTDNNMLQMYFRKQSQKLKYGYDLIKDPIKRKTAYQKTIFYLKIFHRRITSEGVLNESASLTYITILSIVPFLSFLFLIAPDLPFLNLGEKLRVVVAKNFIPGSANAIMNFVDELFMRKVGFNIFNFVLLIGTSYSLFNVIQNTFDRILSFQKQLHRDIITQLVKFFGTIIFGFLISLMLFSSSSIPVVSSLLKLPVLQWMLIIVPFFLQFLALLFLYMLIPSVRIKGSSLIRGAFWTTVVWVLAKSFFDWYIYNLTNMEAIYGVMAVLPIFLMWIYLNWVIILAGVVLVSMIETKDNATMLESNPLGTVRITMEMYADKKLATRLEGVLGKKEFKEIIKELEEEKQP